MNNTEYTLTVNESSSGQFTVSRVSKFVKVNQHRTDLRVVSNETFGFADSANPCSLTKRAARKTRRLPVGKK